MLILWERLKWCRSLGNKREGCFLVVLPSTIKGASGRRLLFFVGNKKALQTKFRGLTYSVSQLFIEKSEVIA